MHHSIASSEYVPINNNVTLSNRTVRVAESSNESNYQFICEDATKYKYFFDIFISSDQTS